MLSPFFESRQLVKIEALNKSLREELDSPLVKNSRQQFIKLSEQKQDFNKQIKTFQIARLELDKEINKIKDKENQIVKIETYYKQKQEIYQNDISTLNRAQTELKVKEDNRINWELAFQQKIHMYESQISERNFEVKSLKSDISLKDSEIQLLKSNIQSLKSSLDNVSSMVTPPSSSSSRVFKSQRSKLFLDNNSDIKFDNIIQKK